MKFQRTTDSQSDIPESTACRMSPRWRSLMAETPVDREVNRNAHHTATVPRPTAAPRPAAPVFRPERMGPPRGLPVTRIGLAAASGLLAATAVIGTAQAQTPAPLDIRTGVYRGQPVTFEVIDGSGHCPGRHHSSERPRSWSPGIANLSGTLLRPPTPDRISDRAKLPASCHDEGFSGEH